MQRIIFHIGLPKTGSSALQVFFTNNRDALLAQSVDYLPISGFQEAAGDRISSGNGAMLVAHLSAKGQDSTVPAVRHAREELMGAIRESRAETGLISSENLADLAVPRFAPLLAEIRALGVATEVVYFIREQEQALCSGYMQLVKRHRCTEAPEATIAASFRKNARLRYNAYYDRMRKLFDADSIRCLIYEEARQAPLGVFGAFLQATGLSEDGLDFETKDINNSLDPAAIGIMLVLNRYAPRSNFSDLVVANARDAGRARSGSTHRLISAELSADIRSFFQADNRAFARRYFQRDQLFPPAKAIADPTPIDVTMFDPSTVIEVLGGLLVRYDQRLAVLEQQGGRLKPGSGRQTPG